MMELKFKKIWNSQKNQSNIYCRKNLNSPNPGNPGRYLCNSQVGSSPPLLKHRHSYKNILREERERAEILRENPQERESVLLFPKHRAENCCSDDAHTHTHTCSMFRSLSCSMLVESGRFVVVVVVLSEGAAHSPAVSWRSPFASWSS